MNPAWSEKTWWRGGGDIPSVNKRYYQYHFEDQWFRWINRYKAEFSLPFDTIHLNTNGDANGHKMVLEKPDFMVRGINVMEWAKESISAGKADFLFEVDAGDVWALAKKQEPLTCNLRARFTDKSLAMLFKLTFGGK